jgi:tetratricopeptide (TPR) repeat protein
MGVALTKAIEYHTKDLAIKKEVGDRAGEGTAYGNLGNAYRSQGDFSKAIKYHAQCLAIAKEESDRAGKGRAYGNLGCAYQSQGVREHWQRV